MPTTVNQFLEHLLRSELMTGAELNEFLQSVAPEIRQQAKTLAGELVRRRKLTKFQAASIYHGRSTGLVLGDYIVLERIASGGMGRVLKARHRHMLRNVAIKVLSSTTSARTVERFRKEIQAAAQLSHPNIVTAYDAGEYHGKYYLVMEIIDGMNMDRYVQEHGPLSVPHATDCIIQAARGLEYAHQKGIIHRDVKPSNLLIDAHKTVKVLDLGLARIRQSEATAELKRSSHLTRQGEFIGTPSYVAPEQALNPHEVDHRVDIYSLGCTLYKLLTGQEMYRGDTIWQVFLAHQDADIPSLRGKRPDIPSSIDALHQKMVAKRPEDRIQSMTEVREGFEKFAADRQVLETPSDSQQISDSSLAEFIEGLTIDREDLPLSGQLDKTSRDSGNGPARKLGWGHPPTQLMIPVLGAATLLLLVVVLSRLYGNGTLALHIAETRGYTPFVAVLKDGANVGLLSPNAKPTMSLKRGTYQLRLQGSHSDRYQLSAATAEIAVNRVTTVTLIRPPNNPPTGIEIDNQSIAENSGTGSVVGVLTGRDPDPWDQVPFSATADDEPIFDSTARTFQLEDDAGGRFTISGNELQVAQHWKLDFEQDDRHTVTILFTDSEGLTCRETLEITVDDASEPPSSLQLIGNPIHPQSPAGTVVGELVVTDPDSNETHRFALEHDPSGHFQVEGNRLKVARPTDLNEGEYWITIAVTDSHGMSLSQSVGIQVSNTDGHRPRHASVDLLAHLEPARDTVAGDWRQQVDHSVVLSQSAGARGRLMTPVSARGSYDLRVQFRQTSSGDNAQFAVHLPVGGSRVWFSLANPDGVTGLYYVNGQPPVHTSDAPTFQTVQGRTYTVDVAVQVDGDQATISARVDGQPHFQQFVDIDSLAVPEDFGIDAPVFGFSSSAAECRISLASITPPSEIILLEADPAGYSLPVPLVTKTSVWQYLDDGSDLGEAWRQPDFDSSRWRSGTGRLGYGDNIESTVVSYGPDENNKYLTTYFRHSFNIPDPDRLRIALVRIVRDDGVALYLNGNEIARDHLEANARFDSPATHVVGDQDEVRPLYFWVDPMLFVRGTNVLAAEVHQANPTSTDLGFGLEMTCAFDR